MGWLRSHPYLSSLLAAAFLIVIGGFVVAQRLSVRGETKIPRAWAGLGTNLLNPTSEIPDKKAFPQENLYTEVQNTAPFYYAPENAQIPLAQTNTDFDFEGFLASLSHKSNPAPAKEDDPGVDPYSFIPRGLLSISSDKERTETEEALFNYANEAASYVETHEGNYRNAAQILKDQFEDPQNRAKNAALKGLADSLAGVGSALSGMEEVPAEVQSAHEKLAKSYQEMGQRLALIPEARSEQALTDSMLAYNAAVEAFTKNYVALATLLSVQGVTFSSEDPGSIFTFSATSF